MKVHVRVWSLAVDALEEEGEEGPSAAASAARVHVVSVQRKEGDPVLFHRVYKAIRTKVSTYVYTCARCVSVCVHCLCLCVRVYVRVCVSVCVCVFLSVYTVCLCLSVSHTSVCV